MTEEERKRICTKINEAHKKDFNIFQKVGWKVLELMWNSLKDNWFQWFTLLFSILTLIIVTIKKF